MAKAVLTISSKNYSSWCLRGWLMAKWAGLDFEEQIVSAADPSVRAELLLQSSSILVPTLNHGDVTIWDTLAIGEYLHERFPKRGCCPKTMRRGHIAGRSAARCIRASGR